MRYTGLMLAVSAVVLNACGGGDAPKPADSARPAASTPPAAAVAAVPAGPDTTTINMVVEGGTVYKFVPADVTVKPNSALKFVAVSGNPHNVAFFPSELPADVKAQLMANMTEQTAELQGPTMMTPNQVYVVSLGGVKAGKYNFDCPLHKAFNMKGSVTVQ
jgi:plastocyanin